MNCIQTMKRAMILTDLSAAFDTVDTDILLTKLNYYGIVGKELKLFNSLMTDRQQYVSIDTFDSKLLTLPRCSTI